MTWILDRLTLNGPFDSADPWLSDRQRAGENTRSQAIIVNYSHLFK